MFCPEVIEYTVLYIQWENKRAEQEEVDAGTVVERSIASAAYAGL